MTTTFSVAEAPTPAVTQTSPRASQDLSELYAPNYSHTAYPQSNPAGEAGIISDITRRHDAVLLLEVKNGNPNGDPDNEGRPRTDPETGYGLISDVCLKRKIRDWVEMAYQEAEGYQIYIKSGIALNAKNREGYEAVGLTSRGSKQDPREVAAVRSWMCRQYYDIRTFGAVMTTKVNSGQVKGPCQVEAASSVEPVTVMELSITRQAVTAEEDTRFEVGTNELGEVARGKQSEMGRKAIIPYGLYRAHIYFNPNLAHSTGFTNRDLAIFWQALANCWDTDRSATRGELNCRGLHIFSHTSHLGNARASELTDKIRISRRSGAGTGNDRGGVGFETTPARSFSDYEVEIAPLSQAQARSITLTSLVNG